MIWWGTDTGDYLLTTILQLFLHNLIILKPDIVLASNSQFLYLLCPVGFSFLFLFPHHLLWCIFLVLRAFFFFCIFLAYLILKAFNCTGRTKYKNERTKQRQPNQPAKQKFELLVVWLFAVRKNGTGTQSNST